MPVAPDLLNRWRAWEIGGAICSEMEAAALFIVSSMLKVRAGGVMQMHGIGPVEPLDNLIKVAIGGLRELIAMDNSSTKK